MKKVIALALSAVLVLSLVACGNTSQPAETEAAATEAATEAAKPAETEAAAEEAAPAEEAEWATVRVAMPRGLECLDDAQYWAAVYNKFFEEEHIDFELVGTSGTDVIKMLVEGQVELAAPSPAVTFTGLAAGMELTSVFQDGYCNIFGVAVPTDSDIQTWADLTGKTVAANSATSYLTLQPMLEEGGADPDSVEYVVAGDQRSVLLAEGKVDAAYTWQKEWQNWAAQGLDIRYIDGEEVVHNCSNSLCCTPEYFENNKEVLARFGRALAKGYMFCKLNPLAAAAIVTAKYPSLGLTAEQALPSIEAGVLIAVPESNIVGGQEMERWQKCLDIAIGQEIVYEGDVDLNELLHANDLVDQYNSYDMDELKELADNFDIDSIAW